MLEALIFGVSKDVATGVIVWPAAHTMNPKSRISTNTDWQG